MEGEEEKNKFVKENPIIFKKYRIIGKIGEGAFGDVYRGETIDKKEQVAVKVEPKKIAKPLLKSEAFILYTLKGFGIPEVISFGVKGGYSILVQPLLGKSLFDLFTERHKRLDIYDICLLAIQMLDRIQWVHSKNIVHRDIKPDNFLLGRKDPHVIYLIDFGLSKKYKSSTTGKHVKFGFTGKLTGTVRFASANALRGSEQSRRDDLESIGYMLIYFMKRKLPWQGVQGVKKIDRYLKIYRMKKNIKNDILCQGLHPEMCQYMNYVKKLDFEQEPDYNYLRSLFKTILRKKYDTPIDKLLFSWITDMSKIKNTANPSTRRHSPQARLYKKIESSLERERNMSSDNESNQGSYQLSGNQLVNLKVIDKNLSRDGIDSEAEQKEPRLQKRVNEKSKDLITTLANFNVTLDENIVDFENERIKGNDPNNESGNILNENSSTSTKKICSKEYSYTLPQKGEFNSKEFTFNESINNKKANNEGELTKKVKLEKNNNEINENKYLFGISNDKNINIKFNNKTNFSSDKNIESINNYKNPSAYNNTKTSSMDYYNNILDKRKIYSESSVNQIKKLQTNNNNRYLDKGTNNYINTYNNDKVLNSENNKYNNKFGNNYLYQQTPSNKINSNEHQINNNYTKFYITKNYEINQTNQNNNINFEGRKNNNSNKKNEQKEYYFLDNNYQPNKKIERNLTNNLPSQNHIGNDNLNKIVKMKYEQVSGMNSGFDPTPFFQNPDEKINIPTVLNEQNKNYNNLVLNNTRAREKINYFVEEKPRVINKINTAKEMHKYSAYSNNYYDNLESNNSKINNYNDYNPYGYNENLYNNRIYMASNGRRGEGNEKDCLIF